MSSILLAAALMLTPSPAEGAPRPYTDWCDGQAAKPSPKPAPKPSGGSHGGSDCCCDEEDGEDFLSLLLGPIFEAPFVAIADGISFQWANEAGGRFNDGGYVAVSGSWNLDGRFDAPCDCLGMQRERVNGGLGWMVAVGLDHGGRCGWRLEWEAGQREMNFDSGPLPNQHDFVASRMGFNLMADTGLGESLYASVGFGLGVAYLDSHYYSDSTLAFSPALLCETGWRLGHHAELFTRLRIEWYEHGSERFTHGSGGGLSGGNGVALPILSGGCPWYPPPHGIHHRHPGHLRRRAVAFDAGLHQPVFDPGEIDPGSA